MKTIIVALLVVALTGCKDRKEPPKEPEKKSEGHPTITLPPEAVRSAQLQTVEVKRRALGVFTSATARITTTQQGVAKIAPRVAGRVVVLKTELGQKVKAGQVLALLESPELGTLRASYMAAATKARVALQNYKREKELLDKGITSEREMRQAESEYAAAKADLDAADSRLHALGLAEPEIQALKGDEHFSARFPARTPINGTVIEVSASQGANVESTTNLFTVADLSVLWVLLDVFESQLPQIRVGQEVELTVSAVPERRFRGRIDYIGDVVDEKTRAVRVRVVVPNGDGLLKPGMFAKAEVATERVPDGAAAPASKLVVPREAVQKVGAEEVVFVQTAPSQFKPTRVTIGESSAQEIEIVSGLAEGQRVVSQGAFVLKSEVLKETMGEGE